MRKILLLAAVALALTACTSKKAQVNLCQMEAERVYPNADDGTPYLKLLSFIATCMRAHDYEIDFKLPGCDGNNPPSPQLRESCYRRDWWSTVGLSD